MKNQQKTETVLIAGEKNVSNEASSFWMKLFESKHLVTLTACFFVGCGLSIALLSLTNLDFSTGGVMGYAIIATAVLALAYIRWWIPVSAFGVIIVGVAIFQFFTGTFAEWIN
ncbi:MAG: hypothetical protein FWD38_11570, partial [Oscillospiraceae bacterium]|nr:hypothetical protein [Oscillospiraceae bacterium]